MLFLVVNQVNRRERPT